MRLRFVLPLIALLPKVLPAQQPLGPEFQVNTYTTSDQSLPAVSSDPAGNFVVAWQGKYQDGSLNGIFGRRYTSGGMPLGNEFRISTYTTDVQRTPSIATDSTGNFVVVWASNTEDGSGYGVFGQRYASGGSPLGTEFAVNTYTTGIQVLPRAAPGAAGGFVVVWDSDTQDGSDLGVFGQRYASDGSPIGPEFQVNSYTTGRQNFPRIASDAAGDFVVVWNGNAGDGSDYGVFGRRFASSGSPLGSEFRVNSYTTNRQAGVSVAADAAGNFVVAWASLLQDGASNGVFGQRFSSSGSPLGLEFRINTYTTDDQEFASIASDPGGNVVVTWGSYTQDGFNGGVYGQRYAASGSPLGAEFRVNSYTTDAQGSPDISGDSAGNFVIVWMSYLQEGSGFGVFGQRFCVPLSAVTISLSGSSSVCTYSTGGTATVADVGGGALSHQWAYRVFPGGVTLFPISTATGPSYLIRGVDFGGAGSYSLVCITSPQCGSAIISNELTVFVANDTSAPAVTAPPGATSVQTLCQ